jgi:hypothetical protein
MTVYVHLSRTGDDNVSFWLPLTAFPVGAALRNGGSTSVFVVKGEKVTSCMVVVRVIEGDQVAVEAGLMKDDRVVLAPPAGLRDGDRVAVGTP